MAAPILVYFVLDPSDFFYRSDQVWFFGPRSRRGRFCENPAPQHMGASAGIWLSRRRKLAITTFPSRPLLNPVEACFFWFGAGMAAWNWRRRPAYRLLLLWTGVLLLPAVLADYSPHFLRMIGAAPAVYLLVGVGIWEAVRLLHRVEQPLAAGPETDSSGPRSRRTGLCRHRRPLLNSVPGNCYLPYRLPGVGKCSRNPHRAR